MSKHFKKLVSSLVLCTSVTNRVLCRLDRFTAYYNCMRKNVTKLITPLVLCTIIKNRVPNWFDRFTACWNCMRKKNHKTDISASSVHKYDKSCSWADLIVLRLIRTLWAKVSQNSYLREFCSLMSQIVFVTELTILRFYYQLYEQKCHKTHITTSFVHNCHKLCP